MVYWQDLPIALRPTPGGPDEYGCWSGCAVDKAGQPFIFYTGAGTRSYPFQTQCLALGSDDLLTWTKYGGNPVIRDVPVEAKQKQDFRDPFVWQEGDHWYMALASRIEGTGGVVFLYRSSDLLEWEYLNPLLVDPYAEGETWECPNFFRLGDVWVLIVSYQPVVRYFIGDYMDYRFVPEQEGWVDYGNYYAPLSFEDSQGRRILFGWLPEDRTKEAYVEAGWAGVQALPRIVSLDSNGRLIMRPIPEVEKLRGQHYHFSNAESVDVQGGCLEIIAEYAVEGEQPFGLFLRCSPDGEEQAEIAYHPDKQQLVVNRERASLDTRTKLSQQAALLEVEDRLRLHVFLDRSVIEIFANDYTCLTSRIYPTRADSLGLRAFGDGLKSLDVWEMRSIWDKE
jgi:beta-fructofuranosidase